MPAGWQKGQIVLSVGCFGKAHTDDAEKRHSAINGGNLY
jgi:hypothetical protein